MSQYARLKRAHTTLHGDRFEAGTVGEILKTVADRHIFCELLKPNHAGRICRVAPENCEVIDPEKVLLYYGPNE